MTNASLIETSADSQTLDAIPGSERDRAIYTVIWFLSGRRPQRYGDQKHIWVSANSKTAFSVEQ